MIDLLNLVNDCLVNLTDWMNLLVTCVGLNCCAGSMFVVALAFGIAILLRRRSDDDDVILPDRVTSPPDENDIATEEDEPRHFDELAIPHHEDPSD